MKCDLARLTTLCAASSALLLAACSGGSSGTGNGTVGVALTDAPACGFSAVNVTVTKVRVHQSDAAKETDGGWTDITLPSPRKINLVDLSNGLLDPLGQASLPAGHYTQLRLVLASDKSGASLNNSVVETGGVETQLATPSAAQSGIKLIHEFDVAPGTLSDLVLDFDACKSVVRTGNGGYLLKPVISVSPVVTSGSISGYVDATLANSVVSAEINGVVVKSTVPDANGKFTLAPLAQSTTAGNYTVVVTADAHVTEAIDAVPVSAQKDTPISTSAMPLTFPTSATNTVSGTVLPVSSLPVVTAMQTIKSGLTVAVAFQNADANTGAYAVKLPIAAPLFGQFGPLPIQVSAVSAAAANYGITASGTGVTSQTTTVNVANGNVTKSFTLQ